MSVDAGNNVPKTRGRPFEPGNPGRPRGARNRATLAAEALLDGEAEGLTRKAVELAKAGDVTALRLCLERVVPPRRDRPIRFDVPRINTANDAARAMGSILTATAEGAITPGEAETISRLLADYVKTLEAAEIEERLRALEERVMKG
jgi:hypothetical protein